MSNPIFVPNGEDTVTVELTVKELLALSGAKFRDDKTLVPNARRKLRDQLTRELSGNKSESRYEQTDYQH